MNLFSDVKLLSESLKALTISRNGFSMLQSSESIKSKDIERDRAKTTEIEHFKQREAARIRSYVEAAARELSLERFARFENDLYQTLLSYVNSTSLDEKNGGILCIRELISCTSASAETKCMRISKALSQALGNNIADTDLVELIADTVGHMARSSPVSHIDYLESELSRALDWLRSAPLVTTNSSSSSNAVMAAQKRFAACVMLQQLSRNAPTIFFARINEFFDLIWGPIWDSKEPIRVAAGRALSACLSVLKERTFHLQWYCYIYDQLLEGFHNGTEEHVHGSTLVLIEALQFTGNFLIPRFKVICTNLLHSKLKEHKSRVVRACIVSLLPKLAELCPDSFVRSHLDEAVEFLKKCSKDSELRPQVLLATGKLSLTIGQHLVARMDDLMFILKEAFGSSLLISSNTSTALVGNPNLSGSFSINSATGTRSSRVPNASSMGISAEALMCISDMVQGLGSPFHGVVLNVLLEPMLQSGLTEELISTLSTISRHMPNQRQMLQMRLLEEAVLVLGGGEVDVMKEASEPDYLYSWARKGVRVGKTPYPTQVIQVGSDPVVNRSNNALNALPHSQSTSSLRGIHSVFSMSSLTGSGPGSPCPSPAPVVNEAGSFSLQSPPASKPKKSSFSFFRSNSSSSVAAGGSSADKKSSFGLGFSLNRNQAVPALSHNAAVPLPPPEYYRPSLYSSYGASLQPSVPNLHQSCELVILSLHTLASLSVPTVNLLPLMQSCVMPYLNSDNSNVRKEAAITCCRMLVVCSSRTGDPGSNAKSIVKFFRGPSAIVVEQIVTRLLEVGISDMSVQARMAVISNLSPEFDPIIGRVHHLRTLFLLLADESFEMKLQVLSLLGRLATLNPAAILSPMRLHVVRLVSELENCPKQKSKEEITLLICKLLHFPAFHALVPPFAPTLIKTLMMLDATSTAGRPGTLTKSYFLVTPASVHATAVAALEAIGELSKVMGTRMLSYADQLLSIFILHMLEPTATNRKQEAALKALGRFVSSTGLVVRPYLEYPQLLPQSLAILCKPMDTQPESLRLELLRTLGLLGALEPARYALVTAYLESRARKRKADRKFLKSNGLLATDGVILYGEESDDGGNAVESFSNMGDDRDRHTSNGRETGNKQGYRREASPFLEEDGDELRESSRRNDKKSEKTRSALLRAEGSGLLTNDAIDEPAHYFMFSQSSSQSIPEPPPSESDVRYTPSNEDYYPIVAINALKKVLKDNSSAVSVHHSIATNTIIKIFKTMGEKCVPFLEQIVPYLLQIVRKSGPGLRESVLQQLTQLVWIAGNHISPYLPAIVDILRDFWMDHLEHVLSIVQQIAIKTPDSLTEHLSILLPLLLFSISIPKKDGASIGGPSDQMFKSLEQVLQCHRTLREVLRPYIHLVVPSLCKLMGELQALGGGESIPWQLQTMQTIRYLCADSRGAVPEHGNVLLSELVHTTVRTISVASTSSLPPFAGGNLSAKAAELVDQRQQELISECISLLVSLAQQLGSRILPFDGLIMRTLAEKGLPAPIYRDLSIAIRLGQWDENRFNEMYDTGWQQMDNSFLIQQQQHQDPTFPGISDAEWLPSAGTGGTSRPLFFQLNQHQLARSWDATQRSTTNDWYEWLWRFNVDLLRESPVPTLRVCAPLAQNHPPLARELFHAAFVSCWHELNEQYQDSLIRNLQKAFHSNTIPPDILQVLLNLAEFMEHDAEALPINLNVLAELAQKGHAYAKALHYREQEFQSNPVGCFESLININKKLDQYDAASGLLKVVQQMHKTLPLGELREMYTVQESWLAKLGHWDEALEIYNRKLAQNPRDGKAIAGKIKCLDALGRWEEAIQLCHESLDGENIVSSSSPPATGPSAASTPSSLRPRTGGSFSTPNNSNSIPSGSQLAYKAAVIGARAAWSLSLWSEMESFTNKLPSDSVDANFMKAVLAVHAENYLESEKYIMQTRRQLDKSMTSLLAESFSRSYVPFVMLQQCSELEEIIEFKILLKQHQGQDESPSGRTGGIISGHQIAEKKAFLTHKWRQRIKGCCSSGRAAIPFWKYLLNCRRMVLSEHEDLDTWLDFVSLCRNGGNSALAERVLSMSQHALPGSAPGSNSGIGGSMDIRIRFAILKQLWSVDRAAAMQGLEQLILHISSSGFAGKIPYQATATSAQSSSSFSFAAANAGTVGSGQNEFTNSAVQAYTQSFLSCLLKLGEWKIAILDPSVAVDSTTREEVMNIFSRATCVDPKNYVAWHEWGLSNYRAIEESKRQSSSSMRNITIILGLAKTGQNKNNFQRHKLLAVLVPNAVKGLLRAISLGTRRWSSSVAQDMLCILTLWFRYAGKLDSVYTLLEEGLLRSDSVHLDNWMGVLPQLIARIDHPDQKVRDLLHSLLVRLGKKHAQALVFPLSVVLKSPIGARKEAAEELMNSLRKSSGDLIEQALMVSKELVRVAILWEETWHWGLEEASRQYFGEGNVQAMLDTLIPLHKTLAEGANTLREEAFLKAYRMDLSQAWECIQNYVQNMSEKGYPIPTHGANRELAGQHSDEGLVHQAWGLYLNVFKRVNSTIPQIQSLELPTCSPALHNARDLDLAVPGTYSVSGQAVRIKSFHPTVAIIRSKQRPRKIKIIGEDGQVFAFLLKGHEDLRQDERAMQLFGLVNALLFNDRRTGSENQDFSIQRYAVVPLTQSAGLISWVPNCDTMHDLIRNYRETRNIMLDVESKIISQAAPNKLYDSLPPIHKLEVFVHALGYTAGEDLAKILWFKSENSESWLQRRATYTRSLAVMSMVGYILGLGDRHPSNLMLDRKTGKVLHIDFGDCFEVAMHREKYPEKVPFRLTRMLVNAMEVAGIEGHFRSTCEKVMVVLRENRDSLVATLEAFVHDPLITWRFVNIQKKVKTKEHMIAAPEASRIDGREQHGHKSHDFAEEKLGSSFPSLNPNSALNPNLDPNPTPAPPSSRRMDGGEFAELSAANSNIGSAISSDLIAGSESGDATPSSTSGANTGSGAVYKGGATSTSSAGGLPVSFRPSRFNRGSFAVLEPVPEAAVESENLEDEEAGANQLQQQQQPLQKSAELDQAPYGSLKGRGKAVRFTVPDNVQELSSLSVDHTGNDYAAASVTSSDRSMVSEGDRIASSSTDNDTDTDSEQRKARRRAAKNKASSSSSGSGPGTRSQTSSLEEASEPISIRPSTSLESEGGLHQQSQSASIIMPLSRALTASSSFPSSPSGATAAMTSSASSAGSVHHQIHLEISRMAESITTSSTKLSSSGSVYSYVQPSHQPPHSQQQHRQEGAGGSGSSGGGELADAESELTEKARVVIQRVLDKLTGLDFAPSHSSFASSLSPRAEGSSGSNVGISRGSSDSGSVGDSPSHKTSLALDVPAQVDRLIQEATSNENLSLCFFGWCPFW